MVRTCPRDALRRSGTRAHRCTRPADAPHAATGGARTRPASLLALEPHRLIAHRTLELFLLLPLPFSLRRPLTLLLLELRLVLKRRKRRKKNTSRKKGEIETRSQRRTASAPIHRSSKTSRETCSVLDRMLMYLLSSASVCSSCSAMRFR